MSWDARLTDDRGHVEGDWNYTHNTSRMIYDALAVQSYTLPDDCISERGHIAWWQHLDGMSGADGAAYLHLILQPLRDHPDHYREMNPENGWGDYDSLMKVLTEMRDAVPEWPCTWSACG